MAIKQQVDPHKYNLSDVNRVNTLPWPRWHSTPPAEFTKVPLKEEYALRTMDYLDTPEARPIFELQADIIVKNNIRGIVDVGCRIGIINDILYERGYTNYNYMGFDTSREPIEYAKDVWNEFSNIEYRCESMYNKDRISVEFNVDCVIWSGILLYNPSNHLQLFNDLTVNFYKASHAIIQEPCANQDANKFLKNVELNTIEHELHLYKENYPFYEDWVVNANIFSGRRRIVHVCTSIQ